MTKGARSTPLKLVSGAVYIVSFLALYTFAKAMVMIPRSGDVTGLSAHLVLSCRVAFLACSDQLVNDPGSFAVNMGVVKRQAAGRVARRWSPGARGGLRSLGRGCGGRDGDGAIQSFTGARLASTEREVYDSIFAVGLYTIMDDLAGLCIFMFLFRHLSRRCPMDLRSGCSWSIHRNLDGSQSTTRHSNPGAISRKNWGFAG